MADWLNIAGGASKGYVEGDQDNQRRQEFQALQNQRKRVEKQQKLDDELTAQLKKVRPEGTYQDVERTGAPADATEAAPDFMGPGSGGPTKKVVRTAADVARERGAIYGGSGRLQDMQAAATQQTLAYQAEQQAEQQKQRQVWDTVRRADALNSAGNSAAALRLIQQGYHDHVPDGHEIVVEERNGVQHSGVAGPDGRYITPPQPVTQQSVQAMIDQGYKMLTPETYAKSQELGIQKTTAGAHVTTAQAAADNAATAKAKMIYETTGDYAAAELAYKKSMAAQGFAHANYFNAASNKEKQTPAQKAQDLIDTYMPIVKASNPGISDAQARLQAARMVAPHDATMKKMNDVQSTAFKKLTVMEDSGAFEGKGGREKRDAFISQYGLEDFVSVDPLTQKIVAAMGAGPGGTGPGAAPVAPTAAGVTAGPPTSDTAAEQRLSEAEAALRKFGVRQKRDNPAGYSSALKHLSDAKAELDALNAKYATTQPTGAAFTSARP